MKRHCTGCLIAIIMIYSVRAEGASDCQGLGGGAVGRFVNNRVIVRPLNVGQFLADIRSDKLKAQLKGAVFVQPIGTTGAYVLDSPQLSTDLLLREIGELNIAEYVEPDPVFTAHATYPNDPEFANADRMWGLKAIHTPDSWDFGVGTSETVVAIIDSGIEASHLDLACNLWTAKDSVTATVGNETVTCPRDAIGYDAIDNDCIPQLRSGHGTQVSGIIGACGNNGKGITGVNWEVSLLSVTFLDKSDIGCASRAAEALEFVRRMKEKGVADVRVVNLSWGGHEESREIEEQLQELAKTDVVIVASAGNAGTNNDTKKIYPAGHSSISTLISVAATRRSGDLNANSNTGKRTVHIAAPGTEIISTDEGDFFRSTLGGTSYAAAFVTGAVALLASQCPGLSALELKSLILNNADEVEALKPYVMHGRFLNVRRAAEACAAAPSCARVKPSRKR